ncbi:MAG: hypothetical protein PHP01_01965 [Phycisphaerae bacterium]|nr:hypothetical protein [Phycisphaerae bacterium]
MKDMGLVLLLGSLLLQSGCVCSNTIIRPVVYVTDTIDGQQYTVSAKTGADGKFANSISKNNKTQTMSGQVTKSDDKYIVEIDYNCARTNSPDIRETKTRIQMQEGQSQKLAGMDNDAVFIRISNK